ncbi:MAG TPA: ISNCY family transposase [Ramlibacter sp.]|uniref:ISNCY family transposase n=1 Tax=Ramlibacter sp. TaxID=1917967 RepID=UPI002CAD3830|nr:ISNCY family transposase [Ramlibacter sp.]HVZ44511.1 ISNCY family transposase [Ramlibacter sp.]
MSAREADRYAVVRQVIERKMTQAEAAAWLGLSVRQVKRLCTAVREDDCGGVISRKRGQPSNRRAEDERERFVELVRQHYANFGPTLAAQYLRRDHGFSRSAETLRAWMQRAGLWKACRAKPQRIHSPRLRRARRGELVQVDGSLHAWFEQRAAKCCLIAFIDDATGDVLAGRFFPVEATRGYLDVLQRHVIGHGRALALYSDRHSIFTKHDPHDPEPTQFERALGELEIEAILAYSPQAKGRVESLFQTLQDRLVKALRLAGISSIEAANAWLPGYLAEHNERFAVTPREADDAHPPMQMETHALQRVCAIHHQRRLSRALTCQFQGQLLVVLTTPEQPRYGLRNKPVRLVEHLDGRLEMLLGEEVLPFKGFEQHQQLQSRVADDKTLEAKVDDAVARERKRLQKTVETLNVRHPGR